MQQGKVKWFNPEKGFGFISRENNSDIFVHFQDIQMEGYKTLNDGDTVTFEVGQTEKGEIARNVTKIS